MYFPYVRLPVRMCHSCHRSKTFTRGASLIRLAPRVCTIRGPSTHQIDMSLNKNFSIGDRNIDLRVQATNVFNMPQYRSIDTTVNSPSFGRVTSAGSMRKMQVIARYRF